MKEQAPHAFDGPRYGVCVVCRRGRMNVLHDPALQESLAIPLPPVEPNPCVRKFGAGPAGVTCRTCALLITHDYHDKRYFKCHMRGDTKSEATDHRVGWRACRYYEPAAER